MLGRREMHPVLVSCPDGAHSPKRAARWSPGTFRPLPPSMTSEGRVPRSGPTPGWEHRCGPASVRGLPGPAPASAVPPHPFPHPFLSLPAGQTPQPRGISVNDHQALSTWPSAPQQACASGGAGQGDPLLHPPQLCAWSRPHLLWGHEGLFIHLVPLAPFSFLGAACCAKHQGPEWSASERLQRPAFSSSPSDTAS